MTGYQSIGLAMVLVFTLASLDSCRKPKNIEKNETNPGLRDTSLAAQDTSKGFLSTQYDSVSHKVTNLFGQFSKLFQGPDTTKGQIVVTPPPPEEPSPAVSPERPELPGFLNSPVKRTVEFDSAGNVIQHDQFLGGDTRIPSENALDVYLKQQEEEQLENGYRAAMHKQYDTGKSVEATTGILGDYNTIQIPIPPSVVPTIFGRPSINLRINGDVAVHLAYRDQQTYATAGANFFGSETGLNFKQEINVSTNGTIGDKLKIGADWGSDRMFQFDNLLKFNYTGFPDEIIQEFDAGNVTWNVPSQYIGSQQDLFGLKAVSRFGPVYITTLAAQKKGERQSKSFGGGSGTTSEHIIKPWEYRRNRFWLDTSFIKFYEPYYSTLPPNVNAVTGTGSEYIGDPKSVQVWVRTTNLTDPRRRYGIAYYDLKGILANTTYPANYRTQSANPPPGGVPGYWLQLDTNRYYVDQYTGILVLSQEPDDINSDLAVSYQTAKNGTAPYLQYGEQGTSDTSIVLKLIKPVGTFKNSGSQGWANIVKNTYYIGGVNFDDKGFSARIIDQKPGGHQAEYPAFAPRQKALKAISVTGLDRYNNSAPADKTPDGLVDFGSNFNSQFGQGYIVDKRTGTLIFPYLEPFGKTMAAYENAQLAKARAEGDQKFQFDTSFYLPEIYTQIQDVLRQRETKLVSINVTFTGGISSTLNLNAFNLVEGSVRVTIGGTPLAEGQDFRVDYNSGTVTILRSDLINTGAINVEYDVHDIFTNATKNILGLRAEVPLFDAGANPRGVIGTTLMNYSMHLPTLKTRQGEEPLSNWIWGADGSYKFDAPFVTDALNVLPFFNLKDKSELSIRGDAALSIPNPNTEKSPMDVDNGASIAYLDDFEGGLNEFPLYLNYGRWVPSSQPGDSVFQAMHPSLSNPDSLYWNNELNRLKMKTIWSVPQQLPDIHEIKPNKQTATASETAQVMDITFDPSKPGIYNPYPDATYLNSKEMWGGLMQYAPGLNVPATNTDAVEFWIQVRGIDPGDLDSATVRFDLGQMSEDIIPDKRLENEDKNGNGRYDPGEDIGLDGMTDDSERVFFSQNGPGKQTAFNTSDPSNDDYSIDNAYPNFVNGQEGNENDANSGLKPDNEDLNGNGTVDLQDGYYEYEIPLNMAKNKYIIGNTNNTWYQLRVPLADFKRIVGTQDSTFSNISYYRLWMKGVQKSVSFRLYEFMLVGSQWTRGTVGLNAQNPIADTSLKVNYVNIEENGGSPTFYHTPPGAAAATIPAGQGYIQGNEQSLNMQLSHIEDTGRREAQRIFPTPNDIFNYRSMAIWVHGDSATLPTASLGSVKDTINRVWVYVRFGTDQYDYYEYRRPLVGGWQNIHIDFSTLINIKSQMGANQYESKYIAVQNDVPGAEYHVVGRPTVTNAPYFVLGMQNETGKNDLNTDIWWDELRLLDANDKPGLAWNGSTQLKLAEFGRITAGMIDESADFHRVDERFNTTRSTNINWNVTGEFSMEKLLPKWMEDKQSKLPLTISHAESILRPKYIVNTDVALDDAIAAVNATDTLNATQKQAIIDSLNVNNETLQIKNSIGLSDIELRFPGTFFLIPALVNRLTFGFGYGEAFLRSPQLEFDRTWSWTASARYSLPQLPGLGLTPFRWFGNTTILIGPYANWTVNLLPNNVSFAVAATRGRDHQLSRITTLTLPPEGSTTEDTLDVLRSRVPLINRVFTATRGMQINWKPFEGGMLSPNFDYSLDVSSNLAGLETYGQFNQPTTLDANGNPIYNYDSIYYYQRNVSDIMRDIFFKDGALVRPGVDYNASQKLHMSTFPRLPGLFGLEKLVRPVFDYRVEYRWLNAQTNLQNAKQGAWNNTITTGLELNVRDLGVMLFGKPVAEEQPQRGVRGRDRTQLGMVPEEIPEHGAEERESPMPRPRNEPRNPVERGEEMRPQMQPNPLGRNKYITDTLHRPAVTAPLDTVGKVHSRGVGTAGMPDREFVVDTVITPEAPPVEVPTEMAESKPPITLKELAQDIIQKPLFDWNGTRFNFTQTNSSLNNALAGTGSGITNFLARGFFAPEDDQNGPSRAYQLGLITDPAGRLLFHWLPTFPFLSFSVRHGLRAADPFGGSTDVTDAFNETNNFELSTSRPLWNGASINLNWKVSFGYDEHDALHINSFGQDSLMYAAKGGDVSRTFFSIPPLPFIGSSVLQSGIIRVGELYKEKVDAEAAAEGRNLVNYQNARDSLAPEVHNRIEREAFMQGFETLPLFTSMLREYLPRLNYSFSWSGLEKLPFFSFADHASIRNAYNGTYRRSFRQDPGDSLTLTSLQTIVYGFRPLIAFDMSWDKLWGGRLTSSLNYDTQTEWAADYASTRITKRLSTTFGITANFTREGLSIPFFKLNLKNQFGASFTLSQTISADSYYNFWSIDQVGADGISNGGLTKTTIEPRVRYDVSSQLTMEAFYRYERTTPAASGLISPPTRLIEAGFDVRLKIQ